MTPKLITHTGLRYGRESFESGKLIVESGKLTYRSLSTFHFQFSTYLMTEIFLEISPSVV